MHGCMFYNKHVLRGFPYFLFPPNAMTTSKLVTKTSTKQFQSNKSEYTNLQNWVANWVRKQDRGQDTALAIQFRNFNKYVTKRRRKQRITSCRRSASLEKGDQRTIVSKFLFQSVAEHRFILFHSCPSLS